MALPTIVLGGGGHAKVLVDALRLNRARLEGFTTRGRGNDASAGLGLRWLGEDDAIAAFSPDQVTLANGIGSTRRTTARREIYERFDSAGRLGTHD